MFLLLAEARNLFKEVDLSRIVLQVQSKLNRTFNNSGNYKHHSQQSGHLIKDTNEACYNYFFSLFFLVCSVLSCKLRQL